MFRRSRKVESPLPVQVIAKQASPVFNRLETAPQLGSAVEMGDAVLALVATGMGDKSPQWLCIRNASDPQIKDNVPLEEQTKKAAQIYEQYGYWTTVCSAVACWALVVGN